MAKHYITIDAKNRIIDGFSDYYRQPSETDILLRDNGGREFELFGKDPHRRLSMELDGIGTIWLQAYDDGKPRYRQEDELAQEIPQYPPQAPIGERMNTAEYDIETLALTVLTMLGSAGA